MTGLMESLRHLSNDIAHDLRTPLGRVQRLLENARNENMSEASYRSTIEDCARELDNVLEMFSAILRISQIESGDRRSGFRKLNLSALVLEICDTFSPAFEEDGRTLEHDVQPGVSIYGDPELLTLSLSNLLENANLHTPASCVIAVTLRAAGDQAELAVSDNGDGVPESLRTKIFERFFRVDSSRATAGNGLGLSIVAAVTDLHAGRVFAEDNRPGLRIGMDLKLA
jgi:signal transduction histidine kinase